MVNKKISLYLDTSVIGGYFDKEFEQDTRLFFKNIKNGYKHLEIRSPKELGLYELG
jgi:hypothetical protein